MSPKEKVIKKVVEDLGLPEDEVEKVISWSYKKANEAVKVHNEVEISGLCKMYWSKAKLRKRIEALERMQKCLENSEEKKNRYLLLSADLEFLKKKYAEL